MAEEPVLRSRPGALYGPLLARGRGQGHPRNLLSLQGAYTYPPRAVGTRA